ncbi:hypothetical protein TRAPUB_4429 [Trametes pubescens]|uniref:Uncharacterized protein n=1 Tax=Trametes pubescens TaxID=154538 RepID=A0A1M2VBF0_TRAPU|nr:hypothetical protein TRAPUB_4429 [Trametes pubescens]
MPLSISCVYPERWDREEFIAPIPEPERQDLVTAYHAQLNAADDETRLRAARAWTKWEMTTSKLYVDPAHVAEAEENDFANAFARIENHYFVNDGFMRDGQLLEKQEIDKIRHIPCVVVQGRYDVICPATTAYALKKVWPEITLHIVPDAGHSSREPGTAKLLVKSDNEELDAYGRLDGLPVPAESSQSRPPDIGMFYWHRCEAALAAGGHSSFVSSRAVPSLWLRDVIGVFAEALRRCAGSIGTAVGRREHSQHA